MEILSRLVSRQVGLVTKDKKLYNLVLVYSVWSNGDNLYPEFQVWKMPKLWVGFLKCVSQTQPHSYRVLLQVNTFFLIQKM